MSTGTPAMTSMVATAPQMTSMYASAPVTYAAQPAMTSMYATPGASMYMPAAAPQMVEYAAPVTTTQSPSYVAAPQYVAAPTVVETVAAPVVAGPQFNAPLPQRLTEGMTEPAKLDAERVAYEKALAAQLKKQSDACLAEASIKKQMMEQTAKKQLAEYQLQIEEQVKMSCLQIDQEAQNLINGLKEAAITQQTAREEQAAIAAASYIKAKAIEDFGMKSYNLQKTWFDKETQLNNEYQKVMKAGSRSVVTSALPSVPNQVPVGTMI